jgi:elongation factor G
VTQKAPSLPRCAALVGPYLSGKTTLLESILHATGVIGRKGSVREGNTVGDATPESRGRQMGTELNVAHTEYLGDTWTFLDCPGSIELLQDAVNAVMAADAAVVVVESGVEKVLTVAPLLKYLGDRQIPHIVFVNKMDTQAGDIREAVQALQSLSSRPLVLRELPIQEGEAIAGLVDLTSERAFKWKADGPSEEIDVPDSVKDWMEESRTQMLEALADFDDSLLERLLEDEVPATPEVFGHLSAAFQEAHIVPVLFGAAEHDNGITRLLKLLRHEAPEPTKTAARLGIESEGEPLAQVFKTVHAQHTGKLSIARVWRGELAEGMTFGGERPSGMFQLLGVKYEKKGKASVGEVVALARMDGVATGDRLAPSAIEKDPNWPTPLPTLYAMAVSAEQRSDEVKLTAGLARLIEEDPSLAYGHNSDTGELLIHGQGDMHLQIAVDRLKHRSGLAVQVRRPQTPYKETIRKPVSQHARHKKQSGGHGQFGDVHLDIKPMPRGEGFQFQDTITGGVVPKQYIPSVEAGVRDYLGRGPLGFPVVDVSVTLTDGQYHSVDSSDMAFRQAAMLGMREGMPKCDPVLLEPIQQVTISVPNEFTSKVQRLISGRRGQILGFGPKEGWTGWDEVQASIPQAETADLINELRSLTLGVGSFTAAFDRLQELSGKLSDDVIAARRKALEEQ